VSKEQVIQRANAPHVVPLQKQSGGVRDIQAVRDGDTCVICGRRRNVGADRQQRGKQEYEQGPVRGQRRHGKGSYEGEKGRVYCVSCKLFDLKNDKGACSGCPTLDRKETTRSVHISLAAANPGSRTPRGLFMIPGTFPKSILRARALFEPVINRTVVTEDLKNPR
jgi:hypothetical protein